jgi:hypothetical protein
VRGGHYETLSLPPETAQLHDNFLYGDGDMPRCSSDTNQNPLHLKTNPKKHQRLTRWGLILQDYNLIIKYIFFYY